MISFQADHGADRIELASLHQTVCDDEIYCQARTGRGIAGSVRNRRPIIITAYASKNECRIASVFDERMKSSISSQAQQLLISRC